MSERTYTADDIAREEAQLDRAAWGRMHDDFEEHATDDRPARAICAGCPVKTECLDFALDGGDHHGVFGGTSERERRSLRRVPIAMRSDERRPCDRDGCTFVALGAPAMAAHVRAHRRADDFAAQRSPLGGVA